MRAFPTLTTERNIMEIDIEKLRKQIEGLIVDVEAMQTPDGTYELVTPGMDFPMEVEWPNLDIHIEELKKLIGDEG
jgi:hypothetical protein